VRRTRDHGTSERSISYNTSNAGVTEEISLKSEIYCDRGARWRTSNDPRRMRAVLIRGCREVGGASCTRVAGGSAAFLPLGHPMRRAVFGEFTGLSYWHPKRFRVHSRIGLPVVYANHAQPT